MCEKDDYLGKLEIELSDLFLHFSCGQKTYSIIDDWFEVDLAQEWKIQKDKLRQKTQRKRMRKRNKSLRNGDTNTTYRNPYCAQLLRQKYDSTTRILQIPNDVYDDNDNPVARQPIYKRLETMPLLSYNDTFEENKIEGKCYIHLQLKLKANWWGNFISHFDPLLPPKPKPKPFNIDLFYSELNKLLTYIWPILDQSQRAMDILFWVKYGWAFVYLLMYGYCVFHPWFFVFWLQFRLLLFSCHSYVKQTVLSEDGIGKVKKFNIPTWLHILCIGVGIMPYILGMVKDKNQQLIDEDKIKHPDKYKDNDDDDDDDDDDESEEEKATEKDGTNNKKGSQETKEESKQEEEEEISMSAFTRVIGNKVVKVSGLKDNLGWYQELLIWINQTIDYVIKLLNWTYVSITMMVVITLIITCFLSVIFRKTNFYKYELLIIGGGIMSYFSKPIQFLQWMFFGLSHWYYQYYCQYSKFKHEIKEINEIYTDFDEADLIEEEEQEMKENDLDNSIMNDSVDNLKNGTSDNNKKTKMDTGLIKKYLYKILDKLTIVYTLCTYLIFGLIEFIMPIFDISGDKHKKEKERKRRMLNKKDKEEEYGAPGFIRSKSTQNGGHKPPAQLKRAGHIESKSVPYDQAQPVYLSADAINHGSGRSVKSKNEVGDLLRRRTYSTNYDNISNSSGGSRNKHNTINKIGSMFKFGHKESDDDGYYQQKKRKHQKIKKSKTMPKQPTLLRARTLKKIESTADLKINSMLNKLEQAKSA